MKNLFILALIICLAGTVSCSRNANGFTGTDGNTKKAEKKKDDKKNDGEDKEKKEEEIVVPVKLHTLALGEISSYILSSATLEAEMSVDIVAETTGIVENIYHEEGQVVKKGETLAVVNFEELKLAKEKAEISFKESENKFNRVKSMFERKLVSQEEYDNTKFSYEQSRLDFENASYKFEKSMIKAPFDGTIMERFITKGQYVSTSQKVFSLVNQDILKVNAYVPEEVISKVKTGHAVELVSEALNKTFNGIVKRVSGVVDPSTGTVKVTVFVDPDEDLRPGMYVKTKIITDTKENAVLVPKKAIVYQNDRKYIFCYQPEDEKTVRVELKEGYQNKNYVEGLNEEFKEGVQIVIAGQNSLKDGSKVKVN